MKKILAIGACLLIAMLVVGTVAVQSVNIQEQKVDKKIEKDMLKEVKVVEIRGDEQWNTAQRELEPEYEEFLTRASSIPQTVEHSGIALSIQKPFRIWRNLGDVLISIEIQHTDYENPGDKLLVKYVTVDYKKQLRFNINKELKPIGRELEELKAVEKELGIIKDPEEVKKLIEKQRELKIKIKEGTIKFAAEIPGELLGDIKPGDILEFPVTVYIEHNSEEVVMKGKTLVFVGYPEEIAGEEINELSDSRIIPWNSAFYKGDQHMHSNYSDGAANISEMADAADNAYAYIIITDHSYDIDTTGTVEPHNSEAWNAIGNECAENTVPGTFLCTRGEEISCDEMDRHGGDTMHYLAYDIDLCVGSYHPILPDWKPEIPDFEDYWYNDETVFDYVEIQQGGFGAIAHQNSWSWDCDQDDLLAVVGYGGIEVLNAHISTGSGEAIGDWQARLDQPMYCYGYGNSDAHATDQIGGSWTYTYGTNLYESDILQSLRTGYATSTNGPFIAYWVEGSDGYWYRMGTERVDDTWSLKMHIYWKSWPAFGPINDITLVTWDGSRIFLFNPDAQGYGYEGSANVTLSGSGTGWLLTRLETQTNEGNNGYTNPIWVYYS